MNSVQRLTVLGAVLVAALAFAGQAGAATINLGQFGGGGTFDLSGSSDEYDFILDGSVDLDGEVTSHGAGAEVHIFEAHDLTGFHALTFHQDQSVLKDGTRLLTFHAFLVSPSFYALTVSSSAGYGLHLEFFGVSHGVVVNALQAATPIPPALLMFGTALVGLFGFGGLGRRRGGLGAVTP